MKTTSMWRFAAVATTATLMGALAGCGSDDAAPTGGEARVVALDATEFAFQANEAITIAAGDTVRFEVRNVGNLDHQMEVLTDASRRLGMTERIAPGATGSTTVTFETAGVYMVFCDIDDHRSLGQQAEFTVVDA